MKWEEIDSQTCSIARSLAIFGDKWTLLILRECFMGVTRFSTFQTSLSIARHRLTNRLTKLVEAGILKKENYGKSSSRYQYSLTKMGLDLYPILLSITQWGNKWVTDDDGPPMEYIHENCGKKTTPRYTCDKCNTDINALNIVPVLGPGIINKLKRGDEIGFSLNKAYEKIWNRAK